MRERIGAGQITHASEFPGHDLYRHLARHFTGRMPPHTVGDDEEAALSVGVSVKTVFVACANAPDVSAGGDGKLHVDGVDLTRR